MLATKPDDLQSGSIALLPDEEETVKLLLDLPEELQLEVALHLSDPGDCAGLCLANPRLGLVARRMLPQYGLLVTMAMRLPTGNCQTVSALLRRSILERRLTSGECESLTAVARKAGSPLGIRMDSAERVQGQLYSRWFLTDASGGAEPTILRAGDGFARSYHVPHEDEHDGLYQMNIFESVHEERSVSYVFPDGTIIDYEGEEPGAERKSSHQQPDGFTFFYQGERGAEWVRSAENETPGSPHHGIVFFYEGERGAEEVARTGPAHEYTDGFSGHLRHDEGIIAYVLAHRDPPPTPPSQILIPPPTPPQLPPLTPPLPSPTASPQLRLSAPRFNWFA